MVTEKHTPAWHRVFTTCLALTIILLLVGKPLQSRPLYPLILIHGFFGSSGQWESTVQEMEEFYGWDISAATHICVNQSRSSTLLSDDLVLDPAGPGRVDSADVFVIDFFNWIDTEGWHLNSLHLPTWSQGHASGPFKQGAALGLLIPLVLERTGSDKVILLAHSLGGLAAREYLQRRDVSGKQRWWPDSTHHVYQLITIGTPHLGSNLLNLGIPFQQEEALRDMRYGWDSILSWAPDSTRDCNVYLFGGLESSVPDNYFNRDIDCNGLEGEEKLIAGLNSYVDGLPRDNPEQPLPDDIIYSWIVSRTVFKSDGVVRTDRQSLPNRGRTIKTNSNHAWFLKETGDLPAFMAALDYPDSALIAPLIKPDVYYEETLWQLEATLDFDWIQLPPGARLLEIEVGNSLLRSIWIMYSDKTDSRQAQPGEILSIQLDSSSTPLRVCLVGMVDRQGWKQPYRFRTLL